MTVERLPAEAPWIETRQVGDATITIISEGGLLWEPRFPAPEAEWRRALPDAGARGRVWLGLNVVFVRLGEALVLIDPGLDAPGSHWQREMESTWADWPFRRTAGLAAAMAELRIDFESVTHVVITHPHGDHYAGVAVERGDRIAPRFPRARHFLGRADWEGNPDRGQPGSPLARLELIDQLGLLELVDSERAIAPGIMLLPAPGETPGHMIVRVESRGEHFTFLGDIVHLACEVERIAWAPPNADHATLIPTRERIFTRAAREHALLATAHEPFPPWGRIVATEDGFRWERT